ncbi:MAG TPA: SH3 domain-containing protein, partial [Rhizomicrobium sp.]|nr:SH3 domain-containing protein [Rhizomicrobium sp.]
GGLGFWAFQHADRIEKFFVSAGSQAATTAPQAAASTPKAPVGRPVNIALPGLRYVHRAGSIIREEPKTSSKTLKKESKGAQITLVSEEGGWAMVTDGNITGYMRASVLGIDPPP